MKCSDNFFGPTNTVTVRIDPITSSATATAFAYRVSLQLLARERRAQMQTQSTRKFMYRRKGVHTLYDVRRFALRPTDRMSSGLTARLT